MLNVVERKSGGLSAGGGISAQGHAAGALPGFIGSASYAQRNLFGLNQKLSATVELGQARSRLGTDLRAIKRGTPTPGFCYIHSDQGIPWLGGCAQMLKVTGRYTGGQPVQDKPHRPLGWR